MPRQLVPSYVRLPWRLVVCAALGAAVAIGVPELGSSTAEAATGARVLRWVDGDTVETNRGTVRLIGIDTPERGRCGSLAARRNAESIAPAGSRIRLRNPASVVDQDRYGRELRYVVTPSGRDLGMAQVKDGARARYDGRDGYQWHKRQSAYRSADAANRDHHCSTTGSSGGSVPVDGECPAAAPIKGNANSMIYHQPWQQDYGITEAEECFTTTAAAVAAGYRASQV